MNISNVFSMLYYEAKLDNWLASHSDFFLDYQVTPFYREKELLSKYIRLAYVGKTQNGKKVNIQFGAKHDFQGNGGAPVVFIVDFSQLSSRSVRNKKPPAMRVGSNCYTKELFLKLEYSCSSHITKKGREANG